MILSDSVTLPHCLNNCREAVKLNKLEDQVAVIPLSWGLITTQLLRLRNKLDWVIGSDLFFDPEVFEKLIFTIKWLLENNPGNNCIMVKCSRVVTPDCVRLSVPLHGAGEECRLVHRDSPEEVQTPVFIRISGDFPVGHWHQSH